MKQERIDKFLSHAGIAPRSAIKKVLKSHTVTVNGKRVTSTGERINPQDDTIAIDGERVERKAFVYYMLNKPMGYISTVSDYLGRDNVTDLIETHARIYPIGRLDKDTHGLLILTNDGPLTHKLIHPKYHIPKKYRLLVKEEPTEEQLRALREGVLLKDGITLPAEVDHTETTEEASILHVTLHEGRNRQIRRMCETLQLTLLDLQRIAFGPLTLDGLAVGEYRELEEKEVALLKAAVDR